MKYERKCNDFISSFLEWTIPRSSAPESFHFFAALFTLSASLRRNVKIPKTLLGSWECYPHLYLFFVGPPGSFKTTTMNHSRVLLDQIDSLLPAPNQVSPQALLNKIIESSDNSLYIFAKEFSDLVSKQAGEQMYEFLTSMFDGDAKFESLTISRGAEYAHEPCLNLLAATTPGWISNHMPETAINGGLASRCILVYEDKARKRQLFFRGVSEPIGLAALEKDLVADLTHISELKGEFDVTPEAEEWLSQWFIDLGKSSNKKLEAYLARKQKHVLSIAMLLTISKSDTLLISKESAEMALRILDQIEPRMIEAFSGIGKNKYIADSRAIFNYIKLNGPVKRKEVAELFEASATPKLLNELIEGLIETGRVTQFVNKEDPLRSIMLKSTLTIINDPV